MADFGMRVFVTEKTPEHENDNKGPVVKGARVRILDGGRKIDDSHIAPAVTGDDGIAQLPDVMFKVEADGFHDYVGIYERPSLEALIPVSLRRRST